VKPLSRAEIERIKEFFSAFRNVLSVYDAEKPEVKPIDIEEVRKRKRPEP
jgi:hypothetical protein